VEETSKLIDGVKKINLSANLILRYGLLFTKKLAWAEVIQDFL
jgi:hypothetical protein